MKTIKLFKSTLGAKGFLYPSEDFIEVSRIIVLERVSFVYSKEYGLIPVKVKRILAEEKDISNEEVFWAEERHLDSNKN